MHPANGCVYKRKMASNYITSFLQSFRKKKKKNVHAVPDHDLNHTRQ